MRARKVKADVNMAWNRTSSTAAAEHDGRLSWRQAYAELAASQKSSKGAPAYGRYVNRPLGRVFATTAYTWGRTPNQVTAVSAVFTFTGIAVICDSVWGMAAGTVRAWFARSTGRLDLVGGAAGLTMIGLGVGLAVSGRKD